METRPLTATARTLLLNARLANGGNIQVELLDEGGNVLPGFRRAASRLHAQDALRYAVSWEQSGTPLNLGHATRDHAVACRFIIEGGALFAIHVSEVAP